MKFLHVFSMAGISEMMCHYGAGDKVLQLKQLDDFGFGEFYGVTETFDDMEQVLKEAQRIQTDYDKIILHDYVEYRHQFPKDKLILVHHGTKLRSSTEIEKLEGYNNFVTTTDLLDWLPSATVLPNLVDLDHFNYCGEVNYNYEPTWFCINRSYQRELVEKKIRSKYPNVIYYERNKDSIIDYSDMPFFLAQYDNYVDWKFNYDKPIPHTIPTISCTGLQALAVGCTVHNSNGVVNDRNMLLLTHDAKRVTERFLKDID